MQPGIAVCNPVDVRARVAHNEYFFQRRDLRALCRCVNIGFERHTLAATHAFVGSYDDIGFAVVNAPGQRVSGKTTEYHGVNRTDPRARQHGHRCLGNHRHVNGDAIAFLCAQHLKGVGEFADTFVQVGIGNRQVSLRIVALPNYCNVVALGIQVAIDAVVADV